MVRVIHERNQQLITAAYPLAVKPDTVADQYYQGHWTVRYGDSAGQELMLQCREESCFPGT
jgi:hypothetical protein